MTLQWKRTADGLPAEDCPGGLWLVRLDADKHLGTGPECDNFAGLNEWDQYCAIPTIAAPEPKKSKLVKYLEKVVSGEKHGDLPYPAFVWVEGLLEDLIAKAKAGDFDGGSE